MRLAFVASLTVLTAAPVWAGGSGDFRDITCTTAGTCIGGSLKERYFVSGNIHGDSEAWKSFV